MHRRRPRRHRHLRHRCRRLLCLTRLLHQSCRQRNNLNKIRPARRRSAGLLRLVAQLLRMVMTLSRVSIVLMMMTPAPVPRSDSLHRRPLPRRPCTPLRRPCHRASTAIAGLTHATRPAGRGSTRRTGSTRSSPSSTSRSGGRPSAASASRTTRKRTQPGGGAPGPRRTSRAIFSGRRRPGATRQPCGGCCWPASRRSRARTWGGARRSPTRPPAASPSRQRCWWPAEPFWTAATTRAAPHSC